MWFTACAFNMEWKCLKIEKSLKSIKISTNLKISKFADVLNLFDFSILKNIYLFDLFSIWKKSIWKMSYFHISDFEICFDKKNVCAKMLNFPMSKKVSICVSRKMLKMFVFNFVHFTLYFAHRRLYSWQISGTKWFAEIVLKKAKQNSQTNFF